MDFFFLAMREFELQLRIPNDVNSEQVVCRRRAESSDLADDSVSYLMALFETMQGCQNIQWSDWRVYELLGTLSDCEHPLCTGESAFLYPFELTIQSSAGPVLKTGGIKFLLLRKESNFLQMPEMIEKFS
ncbi:hypothetical protein V6N13_016329 [Hibiscus sabdariffa]|uniref:Uncharacterized protein n=1 Tax=Hibiscus sabdariffa TaxID=183260 RepID=A0ABR2BH32_9ROSI